MSTSSAAMYQCPHVFVICRYVPMPICLRHLPQCTNAHMSTSSAAMYQCPYVYVICRYVPSNLNSANLRLQSGWGVVKHEK